MVLRLVENRTESGLEDVGGTTPSPVEAQRIALVELLHEAREAVLGASNDPVPVVWHERPAEAVEAVLLDLAGEEGLELGVVAVVEKDGLTVAPARVDVVDATGDELTEPGQPLARASLYDANRTLLGGLISSLGAR